MLNKIMKLCIFSLIAILCLATGCSNSNATTEQDLSLGVYELQESGEPVKPSVELKENNQFVFTYSVFSSYLPTGKYEVENNNLILKIDDEEYQYIFEIENNTLIFNEEESSAIDIGDVKDGSVFSIQEI